PRSTNRISRAAAASVAGLPVAASLPSTTSPTSADGAAARTVGVGVLRVVLSRRRREPRIVGLGVELRELFLESADPLVLIGDRPDRAQEGGVVVGRLGLHDAGAGLASAADD